jgi:hypothetical protein
LIAFAFKFVDQTRRVSERMAKAAFRKIQRGAFLIRQDAIESIKDEEGPSKPGTPPHTHTTKTTRSGKTRKGQYPRAIVYAADRTLMDAVIGPRFSVLGLAGFAHEHGEVFYGQDFDQRPTMGPALSRQQEAFGNSFAGSL